MGGDGRGVGWVDVGATRAPGTQVTTLHRGVHGLGSHLTHNAFTIMWPFFFQRVTKDLDSPSSDSQLVSSHWNPEP